MTERATRNALSRAAVRLRLVGEPSRCAVWTVAAIAGIFWSAVMLLRLLLGGMVGMGDNGDGVRLFCPLGLVNDRPWDVPMYAHVYPTWISVPRYGEACATPGWGDRYYSSQQVVLWLAKSLTPVLGLPGALDLRAVGVLCAVAFGAVTALLVVLLPGPLWLRFTAAAGFGLVMCDSAFADFFISPYSEPAGLIGLMLLCAALLLLWRRSTATLGGIVLTTVALIVVMTAKPQFVGLLPVGLLALLWLPSTRVTRGRPTQRQDSSRLHRLGRWLAVRWPALIASAVLCGVAVGFSAVQVERLNRQVWYNAVFVEMLPHSPDPAGDLRALGAPPALVSAIGSRMTSVNSAAKTPYWNEYVENVTPGKIMFHYLTHPDRLIGMGARGVQAMTHPTLDNYLGAYPPDSGHPPYSKERRIVVVTRIFEFFHSVPALVPLLLLGTLTLGAVLASRTWARPSARAVGRMTVCLVLSVFCLFWLAMLSEGASDIYKHMIPADFLTALCMPLAVLCFWLMFRREYSVEPAPAPDVPAVVPSGRMPSDRSAPPLADVSYGGRASTKPPAETKHQ
jgi:hypothetical protein